ncbi:MAG: hypothetical protein QOF02_3199 [Blastocatellia bacterium]|jgi:beta-lactamase class D|nr:hypothetical protein [Blastocatellia bacterium]
MKLRIVTLLVVALALGCAGKGSSTSAPVVPAFDLSLSAQTPTYTLRGKTSGGQLESKQAIGWFVCYVEARGNVYFFATNIEGPDYLSIRDKRIELTRQILKSLGVLPSA